MTIWRVSLRSSAFFFLALVAVHVPACEYGQDTTATTVIRLAPVQVPADLVLDSVLPLDGSRQPRA